jgi:hypothetical protein
MIPLDVDVLIDCLRGLPSVERWLRESSDQVFGIPGIVAMEPVVGCRDKADLRRVQAFIRSFGVIWPDANDFRRAFDLLVAHRLEFGVRAPDCIVAATALGRSIPLYTFNVKHFQGFAGLEMVQPCAK